MVGALGRTRTAIPPCVACVIFLSVLYCTAIFAVLNGRPLQSDHALLSPLSSLFSTALCYAKCLDCNLLNPCPPPFISKHTAAR